MSDQRYLDRELEKRQRGEEVERDEREFPFQLQFFALLADELESPVVSIDGGAL